MTPLASAAERAPFADVQVGENRVALLKDGLQAYPAMAEAVLGAQSTVCLETYILANDAIGKQVAAALEQRARAGVEVSLMYDGWGTSLSDAFLLPLKLAGVRVLCFRPLRFSGQLGTLFARLRRRNHRKALIVDGRVAFTGGLNLSADYAAVEDGGRGWRDTHVRLSGPAALQLQQLFVRTWQHHGGAPLDLKRYRQAGLVAADESVRIVGNDFRVGRKHIHQAYLEAISRAQKSIRLTHAYCLPHARLLKGLRRAAHRGVQVRIIVAAATDVKMVLLAARGLYPKLLRAGVRVFEWEGPVLHAKTAVVDGCWSTIGSANLDELSLRQNLEVNAVVNDAAFAQALERLFEDDLRHCEEITPEWLRRRGLLERALSWVAFQLRSFL